MPSIINDESAPIGAIQSALLTEAQFQAQFGTSWVLADGRNVAGSKYATITLSATIPDLRGMVLRGKNNGRSDGNQDPGGERAVGDLQNQATAKNGLGATTSGTDGRHNHRIWTVGPTTDRINWNSVAGAPDFAGWSLNTGGSANIGDYNMYAAEIPSDGYNPEHGHAITVASSDAETRMRNVAVNHFIKIN